MLITEDVYERIEFYISGISDKLARLEDILYIAQTEIGYLPIKIQEFISEKTEISLTDIQNCTPKNVRITKLYDNGNSEMRLEGMALSYESVRLFVNMLNRSDYISSASMTDATKNEQAGGVIMYIINCSLTKGKSNS